MGNIVFAHYRKPNKILSFFSKGYIEQRQAELDGRVKEKRLISLIERDIKVPVIVDFFVGAGYNEHYHILDRNEKYLATVSVFYKPGNEEEYGLVGKKSYGIRKTMKEIVDLFNEHIDEFLGTKIFDKYTGKYININNTEK